MFLKGLTRLHTLDLTEAKITDNGLEHLNGLSSLRNLCLVDTLVTDAGIRDLKKAVPGVGVTH